jgi:hypothetical protein
VGRQVGHAQLEQHQHAPQPARLCSHARGLVPGETQPPAASRDLGGTGPDRQRVDGTGKNVTDGTSIDSCGPPLASLGGDQGRSLRRRAG